MPVFGYNTPDILNTTSKRRLGAKAALCVMFLVIFLSPHA